MPTITIVTACFNEADNVEELHRRIRSVMATQPDIDYLHLFIDNASTDPTVSILRRIAADDPHVAVIRNARNFGHLRSPYHGILQAPGDAVVSMASDLQDPPELLPQFLDAWRGGAKVAMGVKIKSEESLIFWTVRTAYYRLIKRLADTEVIEHATGFGIYDREVVDILRDLRDPYPYFRGLISEIGFPPVRIPFEQPLRRRGITKNNAYTLWDTAMLGLTTHTRVPLRLTTFAGFGLGGLSFCVSMLYLVWKLLYWDTFELGWAPVLIGIFLLGAVQLVSIGMLGEYVGAVLTHIRQVPHAIEAERFGAVERLWRRGHPPTGV